MRHLDVCNIILSLSQQLQHARAKSKTLVAEVVDVLEEEIIKIEDEPQEDTVGHGVVNPIEACHHVQLLDEAMQTLESKIKMGEIKNILKDALEQVHSVIQ